MEYHSKTNNRLNEEDIDSVGHIIRVPALKQGDKDYNSQIEVFDPKIEGDRAQVYQMWAVNQFAEHPVALEALKRFNLAGNSEGKESWTQLLEHISGVAAAAITIEKILEKHGAQAIDVNKLIEATLHDNLEKPLAVMAGREALATAVLLHDLEKPAEIAAAQEMAKSGGAGGYENSLDNPVLQDGVSWRWMYGQVKDGKLDEPTVAAAQNTGRGDRLYSEYNDYPEDMVKKAIIQRESLATLLGITVDEVNNMTPSERRQRSITAKERMAAIVGIADALTQQFKFQGLTEADIDATAAKYLTRKKDPESVVFFRQDWPEYYKEVLHYLLTQVPEENQPALKAELNALTHEKIFNQTVLPAIIGDNNPQAAETLRYPEASFTNVETWTQAKATYSEKNEDQSFVGQSVIVLADGATDKTGITYPSGKSGGRELAEIATKVASKSLKTGYELADEVTSAVRKFYETSNPEALEDASKRAATTLVTARIVGDSLVITQVGDTNVRITKTNGTVEVLTNDKLIDTENAQKRSEHIKTQLGKLEHQPEVEELTKIIASGRAVIQDRLNTQYKLQNDAEDSRYGYGTIDGQVIPREFNDGSPTNYVKTFTYSANDVAKIELVSDGFYGEFPDRPDEASYRLLYSDIHANDPHKYEKYLSTKPLDDATVVIADFKQ